MGCSRGFSIIVTLQLGIRFVLNVLEIRKS